MTDATFRFSPVGVEALDDPAADPHLVSRMLRDIARSNRWLGGTWAMRFGMSRLVGAKDRGHTMSLLDIGTGAGDLPRDAVRWAAARGVMLEPLGIERIPAAALLAHRAGVPTALACAGALPFADQSVDIVLLSQIVHHLDEATAVRLIADATRIARRGVILADLRPAPFAGLAFRLAGFVLRMHQVTIDDGVTSIRRAFPAARLREICAAAGVRDVEIARRPVARLVASWRTRR